MKIQQRYLNKDQFYDLTKKLEDGHWTQETIDRRWDYHRRVVNLIQALKIENDETILEMGTMGIKCVANSHTIDYLDKWDFPGKKPTYIHDARTVPWPIANQAYDLFIALRVFQHLSPFQKDAFNEAKRIARKIVLIVPNTYENPVHPNSLGITYNDFLKMNDGVHPNLFFPTSFGDFYYWNTEKPSNLDLSKILNHINVYTPIDAKKPVSLFFRIKRKLRRMLD